jgi:hypothetical protein
MTAREGARGTPVSTDPDRGPGPRTHTGKRWFVMRKKLLAGALLGTILGLVFVAHDSLRLTVAWPVVLGFALWDRVGDRGSHVFRTSLAALVGGLFGFLAFAAPTALMPLTDLSLGIAAGVTVGVIAVIGLLAGDRLPMPAMLVGFGTFFGVFWPLYQANPGSIQTHGMENLTVVWLGLLVGVLAVALVRAVTDAARVPVSAIHTAEPQAEAAPVPLPRAVGGGAAR